MIGMLISLVVFILFRTLALIIAMYILRETPDYVSALIAGTVTYFVPYFMMPIGFSQYSSLVEVLLWIVSVKILVKSSWKNSVLMGILGFVINTGIVRFGIPGMVIGLISF